MRIGWLNLQKTGKATLSRTHTFAIVANQVLNCYSK